MEVWQILVAFGVPSAITGLAIWHIQRKIAKLEAKREEHERNIETLILYQVKMNKANYILSTATAKAVQRIPEAKCNGDMRAALEEAQKIEEQERNFITEKGISSIF